MTSSSDGSQTQTRKSRDKLLYEETYKKGAATIRPGKLPTLYHVNPEFRVLSCEIQKAGSVERDGQRLEYQVLKVFLEERPVSPAFAEEHCKCGQQSCSQCGEDPHVHGFVR